MGLELLILTFFKMCLVNQLTLGPWEYGNLYVAKNYLFFVKNQNISKRMQNNLSGWLQGTE